MHSKQIMIIEDDHHARTIFEKVLNHQGYETVAYADGDHAVRYLLSNQPDIVLLDMNIPIITGHEILQFIRQQDHLAATKVIIISADFAMSSANDEHADFVMMKPVNTRHLCQLVDRLHANSLTR